MGTQSTDNSFIQKLKSSGRSLVAFYGSQTGTGEEFAGRLAKEGIRYRMKGMVADPEECDMVIDSLKKKKNRLNTLMNKLIRTLFYLNLHIIRLISTP